MLNLFNYILTSYSPLCDSAHALLEFFCLLKILRIISSQIMVMFKTRSAVLHAQRVFSTDLKTSHLNYEFIGKAT